MNFEQCPGEAGPDFHKHFRENLLREYASIERHKLIQAIESGQIFELEVKDAYKNDPKVLAAACKRLTALNLESPGGSDDKESEILYKIFFQ